MIGLFAFGVGTPCKFYNRRSLPSALFGERLHAGTNEKSSLFTHSQSADMRSIAELHQRAIRNHGAAEPVEALSLQSLQFYQLALASPQPPAGSFDPAAADRGDQLFSGKAKRNNCHVEPLWTDPGRNRHTPSEVCVDSFQAKRAPDLRYRTSPIGFLFTHLNGSFYHDGRFPTLDKVVDHCNTCMQLGLTDAEKSDLIQYLLSLTFGSQDPQASTSASSSN